MDLGVELVAKTEPVDRAEMSMKIVKGVLITTSKQTSKISYTIKNRSDESKLVLVEHPLREQWQLVQPAKADETTRSLHRFEVAVAPGKTETLTVVEEMPISEQVRLTSESADRVAIYLRAQTISEPVKAALAKIIEMKMQLATIDQDIAQREARLKQIGEEQERIRQNMEELDRERPVTKVRR